MTQSSPTMIPGIAAMSEYQRAEIDFRINAFRILYNQTFANEEDLVTRFAKAIYYSSKPIRKWKQDQVIAWHRAPKPCQRWKKTPDPQPSSTGNPA